MATNKKRAKATKPVLSQSLQDLEHARRKYAREWDISSNYLAQQGCYEWMASASKASGLVLEIGCGIGLSTAVLLKGGCKVVVVEENTACIRRARQYLEEQGYSVAVHYRGTPRQVGAGAHKIDYSTPLHIAPSDDVTIIEGDILNDTQLEHYLLQSHAAVFDAVVCWLIGTHMAMGFNEKIQARGIDDSYTYRLLLQNSVYEHADVLLRPGGTLHVVDRGEPLLTPESEKDLMDSHIDQASVTSIVPTECAHFLYKDSDEAGAKQMVMTSGKTGHTMDEFAQRALLSVRSVKPGQRDGIEPQASNSVK